MLPNRRTCLAIAIATAFSASHVAAAEDIAVKEDIEVIVVTASGVEQKLVDAPASISVITQEELTTRPYMTLLDAVRDLEGVDIGETRDKTGQGTISMRGMGSDYTLILINGRRQNNHGDIYPNSFGGNQFNHIPPLDAIDRIEVIRGPASTLYGADAMGGVINIITKKVLDKWVASATVSRTIETKSEFGDDTTVDLFVTGALLPGVLNISARGSWYDRQESNPTYALVEYPNGETRVRSLGFGGGGKTVDNTNIAAGISLLWTPAKNQTLTLDYDLSKQEYDNKIKINDQGEEEYPVGTVDNINSIWLAANVNGVVRVAPRVGYSPNQEFTRDSWSLTHEGKWDFGNSFISLSYVDTNNDGRTLPFSVAERNLLQQMWDATGDYAGLTEQQRKDLAEEAFLPRPKRTLESSQYTLDAKLDIPFELSGQHVAVIGTQVIRGELEDSVFGMESGTPGGVQKHNMWSLFAEDTWYVVEPFSITAGLRYDDHQVFGDHVSPRLYGNYTINDQWTVKGGVSTGYKTPKTTQLYDGVIGFGGQGVSPMFGNPDLKPETSVSTEIAAYWQHPTERHNFNVTLFRNKFEDKIASQPCGTGTSYECSGTGEYADFGYATSSKTVNIDEVVLEGAEVAGRYQILSNFGLRANYTYTDSEQKSGANAGLPLGNSAKHMANATVDWQASDKLNIFFTLESRSKRYRSWDIEQDKALYYKDYEVFHLGASYKLLDNVTLNGRINNLFDRDFTTYDTVFSECVSGNTCVGGYAPSYVDHYNNKDKARNFWVSVNVQF
ncbi:TonB-dependent receptor [Chromatiaceae bacterium AAb-1]|nr:TonB-dependent receptor [Chromatiaceae bacterium AAb-1]